MSDESYDLKHHAAVRLDFEYNNHKIDCKALPPFDYDELFLGCQRGILCYLDQDRDNEYLIFFNSLTRDSRKSCSDDEVNEGRTTYERHYSHSRYFFGYDAVTDDFKVLKITRYGKDECDCVLYTSQTDSWKRVKGFYDIYDDQGNRLNLLEYMDTISQFQDNAVFVEGTNCMHMIADVEGVIEYSARIMSFDFSAEKFNVVPLPCICTDWDDDEISSEYLSSLDGCLCFIHESECGEYLNAWIMKEYVVQDSWALLLSIPLNSIVASLYLRPIGFVNNGRPQLLMISKFHSKDEEKKKKTGLYLYDIGQKQLNSAYDDYLPECKSAKLPQHFLFTPSHMGNLNDLKVTK